MIYEASCGPSFEALLPGARAAARHGGARGSVRLQGGPVPQLGVRGQAPGQLRRLLQWDLQSSLHQCYVVQVRQIFSHIKESHKDALTRDDKEATDFTLTCLLQEGFQEREVGLSTHSLSTHSLSTHYLLARWAPGSP